MAASQKTGSQFRRRTKLIMLGLASVFALLLGEVAIRVLGAAPTVKPLWLTQEGGDELVYMRSSNPVLGFELKPNYRNDNADLDISLPRTNAHGQRDIERKVEKPATTRRVMLLGDSVVEGHGLAETDDTISRQLEQLYPDGNTEILNFGVSGYCTRAEIELLQVKGLSFSPDVVVLVFTENDFQDFNPEALQVDSVIERPAVVKQMFLTSHLFRLLSIQMNWFQFGVETDPVKWNSEAIGENNVTQGFSRLAALQKEHNFTPLIAVWPRFTDNGFEDMHRMPESNELIVERLANLYGLPLMRLSVGLKKHLEKEPSSVKNPRLQLTIGDGLHPNAEGSQVAASILKPEVDRLLSSDSPPASHPPDAQDVEQELAAIESALRSSKHVQANPQSAYAINHNNTGLKYEQEGKLDKARECYLLALKANPAYAEASVNLAALALNAGDLKTAATRYADALKSRPDMLEAQIGMGLICARTRRPKEARQYFRQAVQSDPSSEKAHFNLGALSANLGDINGAVRHFEDVLKLNPKSENAMLQLANLFLQRGQHAEAEKRYGLLLSLNPHQAEAHNNWGISLSQQGRLQEAKPHFEQAVRIAPSFQEAHSNLARLNRELPQKAP